MHERFVSSLEIKLQSSIDNKKKKIIIISSSRNNLSFDSYIHTCKLQIDTRVFWNIPALFHIVRHIYIFHIHPPSYRVVMDG